MSTKKKILSIVGARPQFVKMAVVSKALRAVEGLEEVSLHTGQHSDVTMSQLFFDEMEIPPPRYQLGISGTGGADKVQAMQRGIEAVIDREMPDWILVYGDTYSTLAGAQAADSRGVSLAHVEAGLRSHDPEMPEEYNRVTADRLSSTLFVPTEAAMVQLRKEGLVEGREVRLVGDVMFDAMQQFSRKAESSMLPADIPESGFVLCTIHRAATTDDPSRLAAVVEGLNRIAQEHPVVFPLHPRTAKRLAAYDLQLAFPTHPPQGYLSMIQLLQRCTLVVTDSGGLQKEAFFSGKFCVTVRDETEWTELVDAGYNLLAGTDPERMVKAVRAQLENSGSFQEDFYGRGDAAQKIAAFFADA